jgi:putative hydrolase of the HAD superfamily
MPSPARPVVVFDYGEVISHSPGEADRQVLAGLAGVDPERFWPEYWAGRDDLDRGIVPVAEYWRRVGLRIGADWTPARIHELWVADFRSWLVLDPEVFELVRELHEGGTRTALLSNAAADYGSAFRSSPLGELFDRIYVSGELRLLKPEPAIYEHVLADLGITAEEMVFIDNQAVNIDGAAALGIRGHVYTGVAELRAFLQSLD